MAAYPTLSTGSSPSYSSDETTLDDLQVDRASNGKPRVRALYDTPMKTFSVVHQLATDTDKATIVNFYAANRLISFTFTWVADGQSYTCFFSGPPKYKPVPYAQWEITVTMIQA